MNRIYQIPTISSQLEWRVGMRTVRQIVKHIERARFASTQTLAVLWCQREVEKERHSSLLQTAMAAQTRRALVSVLSQIVISGSATQHSVAIANQNLVQNKQKKSRILNQTH